jgi:ankyrin repeat protein
VAAFIGSEAGLLSLARRGADLETTNALSRTPLATAIFARNVALVKLLLELGANKFACDGRQRSMLHLACLVCSTEIVAMLIAALSPTELATMLNKGDRGRTTPLEITLVMNDHTILEQLLIAGADPMRTSQIEKSEVSAILRLPNSQNSALMIRLLVEYGLNLAALNPGANPLHCAVWADRADLCQAILSVDATLQQSSRRTGAQSLLEVKDESLRTALWLAAVGNRPEICRILLSNGADVNVECPFEHNANTKFMLTPVAAASMNGHADVVTILVESGAQLDKLNASGFDALGIAAGHGYLEGCRLLLNAGARHDIKYASGITVLLNAARNGHVNVVKFLLEQGVRAWPFSTLKTWYSTWFDPSIRMAVRVEITMLLEKYEIEKTC